MFKKNLIFSLFLSLVIAVCTTGYATFTSMVCIQNFTNLVFVVNQNPQPYGGYQTSNPIWNGSPTIPAKGTDWENQCYALSSNGGTSLSTTFSHQPGWSGVPSFNLVFTDPMVGRHSFHNTGFAGNASYDYKFEIITVSSANNTYVVKLMDCDDCGK